MSNDAQQVTTGLALLAARPRVDSVMKQVEAGRELPLDPADGPGVWGC